MSAPFQFTCARCGAEVTFMDAGLFTWEHRNQCPYCLYSRHVMFGCADLPPCGALMRPVKTADDRVFIQECEGCGFRWVAYDEDWWALLSPARQTALINLAFTETARQNGHPVIIFTVRPQYRSAAPAIPAGNRGTRTRVTRRP